MECWGKLVLSTLRTTKRVSKRWQLPWLPNIIHHTKMVIAQDSSGKQHAGGWGNRERLASRIQAKSLAAWGTAVSSLTIVRRILKGSTGNRERTTEKEKNEAGKQQPLSSSSRTTPHTAKQQTKDKHIRITPTRHTSPCLESCHPNRGFAANFHCAH